MLISSLGATRLSISLPFVIKWKSTITGVFTYDLCIFLYSNFFSFFGYFFIFLFFCLFLWHFSIFLSISVAVCSFFFLFQWNCFILLYHFLPHGIESKWIDRKQEWYTERHRNVEWMASFTNWYWSFHFKWHKNRSRNCNHCNRMRKFHRVCHYLAYGLTLTRVYSTITWHEYIHYVDKDT